MIETEGLIKICTIIPSLFIFFCVINSSSADSCNTTSCPRSRLNSSVFTTEVSVRSPFRLNPIQAKSCGYDGFDLYCDNTLGTLIQFSNGVALHVDDIYYYSNLLILSDPYDDSLVQKLLSFDLDDTPFHPANDSGIIYSEKFRLYNCSVLDSYDDRLYDRIDCLSGSGYTVISAKFDTTGVPNSNSCTFLTILTVSTASYNSSRLCSIHQIALTWSRLQEVPPAPPAYARKHSHSDSDIALWERVLAPLTGTVIPITIILLCYHRFCRNNAQATTSTTNNQSRVLVTSCTVTGLDQVTIDSYPVVVVGASGRLIKPDDNTCPICLSDYCPHETLKILPECLHRFHVDCIDQWLRSKGVCPICRTSTPHTS